MNETTAILFGGFIFIAIVFAVIWGLVVLASRLDAKRLPSRTRAMIEDEKQSVKEYLSPIALIKSLFGIGRK
jgi:hypothetical protein